MNGVSRLLYAGLTAYAQWRAEVYTGSAEAHAGSAEIWQRRAACWKARAAGAVPSPTTEHRPAGAATTGER